METQSNRSPAPPSAAGQAPAFPLENPKGTDILTSQAAQADATAPGISGSGSFNCVGAYDDSYGSLSSSCN